MSKLSRSLFFLFVIVLFAGCSSTKKRRCNQAYAVGQAYDDVKYGRMGSPGLQKGRVCEEVEYVFSSYQKDYVAGVAQAKKEYCTSSKAADLGRTDGMKMDGSKPSKGNLRVCMADNSYTRIVDRAFEKGYKNAYCSEDAFRQAGVADANKWEKRTSLNARSVCGASRGRALNAVYKKAFKKQMEQNCSPVRITGMAAKDARAKKNMSTRMAKLSKCPAKNQFQIIELYRNSYNDERSRMMEEERLRMEQKKMEHQQNLMNELLRQRSGGGSYAPPYDTIVISGSRVEVSCRLNSSGAKVTLRNTGSRYVDASGSWYVEFFDSARSLKRRSSYRSLRMKAYQKAKFTEYYYGKSASHCRAYKR